MTGSLGFKGPQSSSDHLIVHPLVLGHLLTILAHGAPTGALTPLAVVVGVDTCNRPMVMHMLYHASDADRPSGSPAYW